MWAQTHEADQECADLSRGHAEGDRAGRNGHQVPTAVSSSRRDRYACGDQLPDVALDGADADTQTFRDRRTRQGFGRAGAKLLDEGVLALNLRNDQMGIRSWRRTHRSR